MMYLFQVIKVSTKAKISKEISSNTCISIKDSKQFLESFLNLVKSQKSKKLKSLILGLFIIIKAQVVLEETLKQENHI